MHRCAESEDSIIALVEALRSAKSHRARPGGLLFGMEPLIGITAGCMAT